MLSLEIATWVCVVVVQAILHFVVLGARQERIQQDEDLILEESLSLATNESALDTASIDDLVVVGSDPSADVGGSLSYSDAHPFPDISLHDGERHHHHNINGEDEKPIPDVGAPTSLMILGHNKILLDGDEDPRNFLHLLSQTGSEMVKVSFCFLVRKSCDDELLLFYVRHLDSPPLLSIVPVALSLLRTVLLNAWSNSKFVLEPSKPHHVLFHSAMIKRFFVYLVN
jgi:hypothetical protein